MLASLLLASALSADYQTLIAFDTVDVAPGVIAFMPKVPETPVVSGNSVAILGEDAVLVVDSGHFPEATRQMIAILRARTKAPVRYLVNTHWHGDHNHGNSLYQEAFPGVAIISTEATRARFDHPFIKDEPGEAKKQMEQYKGLLASGKTPSGKPLTDLHRKMLSDGIHQLEIYAPDLGTSRSSPPDLTFEDKLTLHLGKRDAQVLFLGRGNTGGDTLVYLPAEKVLMTGDLVVYPAPYAFGSFLGEWGPTLRKAMALDATTLVPGHGPLLHDKTYPLLVADAAEAVSAQVRQLAGQGLSLDEVRKKLDLQKIRERFARGNDELGQKFDGFFLGPGVPRAYREAKEGPLKDED